jgi:transposase
MDMPWKAQSPQYFRRLAVEMVEDGDGVPEIATLFGVSERSVWRWLRAWRAGGQDALASAPRSGRPPKITGEVAAKMLSWLAASACDFGFVNDRWTARRLACVLQRESGVALNRRYLNGWLARHAITPQVPQRVPRERNEAKVASWVAEQWPLLKKRWSSVAPPSVLPMKAASF